MCFIKVYVINCNFIKRNRDLYFVLPELGKTHKLFLVVGPLRVGGGLNPLNHQEKKTFFFLEGKSGLMI